MSQIIIGYTTEGTTDVRFLESIIQRTFIEIGFECQCEIEVIEPIIFIKMERGLSFSEQIVQCSQYAFNKGVMAFCIHVDADSDSDDDVFQSKMKPAIGSVAVANLEVCDNLVPIVPIQMTESWMLADKQLLKDEIGTDMSDAELNIIRRPESIRNPKEVINEAIRIARAPLAKRRRKNLNISELYQPIGQKISIDMLNMLPSYLKFKEEVRNAYRKLNYLH